MKIVECPVCSGTGFTGHYDFGTGGFSEMQCQICNGTGLVKQTREIYIRTCSKKQLIKFFCENAVDIDCLAGNPYEEDDFKEWLEEEYEK